MVESSTSISILLINMSPSLLWVNTMLIPERVGRALPREDLVTFEVEEVGGFLLLEDSATIGAKEVMPKHLDDSTREVAGGAGMTSTSSLLIAKVVESLSVEALYHNGGALIAIERTSIEGPGHGHLAMTSLE